MTQASSLELTQVTLCAATSVNVEATVRALRRCMRSIRYAKVLLFTDDLVTPLPPTVERVPITRLRSTAEYSSFLLRELPRWVDTTHCLIVQWDGFVLDASHWDPQFLDYDYIGAPWPQFQDGHDVGNGGFSLRSRRLLEACLDPDFNHDGLAEDLTIARSNRAFLESRHQIKFAQRDVAARFSFERPALSLPSCRTAHSATPLVSTFGFHGVFNMVHALGPSEFGEIYRALDHKASIRSDLWRITRQLVSTRGGRKLALKMLQSELRL